MDWIGIITAIITPALTLVGVIIANQKSTAVTNYKIEELSKHVEKHNNFAERLPVVEEQIKTIFHQLDDLK